MQEIGTYLKNGAYPEPAVLEGVDDAVDGEGLPVGPGGLHHGARAEVEHLICSRKVETGWCKKARKSWHVGSVKFGRG